MPSCIRIPHLRKCPCFGSTSNLRALTAALTSNVVLELGTSITLLLIARVEATASTTTSCRALAATEMKSVKSTGNRSSHARRRLHCCLKSGGRASTNGYSRPPFLVARQASPPNKSNPLSVLPLPPSMLRSNSCVLCGGMNLTIKVRSRPPRSEPVVGRARFSCPLLAQKTSPQSLIGVKRPADAIGLRLAVFVPPSPSLQGWMDTNSPI
jgi:hypothetical protein